MAQFKRTDRFGNPTALVGCKANKKGFPVGYLEVKGTLLKLEPGQSNKDGVLQWIKVTAMKKNQGSSGFNRPIF